ncbi:DUF397 domain-containing protein [Streptomyces olivaceus]|uniref:DUF397 domain-containing protein n=1 Tax=Streptomyces olivaceus TaxID=47716 RepID=UPI001CCB0D56|nr:DUF397 domain-containing protein [Streptomyces olivaceus]MBZ6289320.1 DUF397 domain-containing protein [Streptomyces olivaceus]MBZ6325318.1 DUF397 domain-containing protein [Streptomyces olivaceus]MBZ6330613.1 DUF397 domain-containing protein [Streptomyces olivaceus]
MIRKTSSEDASDLAWFKSSYSSGSEGDSCVEIATVPGTVHVRDSKDVEGPRLAFAPAAWAGFVPYAAGG